MGEAAIALRGVTFSYGRAPILDEVTVEIAPRETVCLVGPNGGGKTTFLRLVLGLVKPTRGVVRVLGKAPRAARARLGYMPQQVPLERRFPITARQIVAMGRLRGWWPPGETRADRRAVETALEEVDLRPLANEPFFALSGGQRQRVLIARALATEPDILLLDEPTAMVDPHIETRLLERLRARRSQLTIVLVSHDIAFVQQLVQTVLCVNRWVKAHPVDDVRGGLVPDLYGEPVRAVRHGPPGHGEMEGHHG